jgi:ribosome biogenesis GTPase A
MAKALRQVKENLKLVDLVLELTDARLPESARNPQIKELLANKSSLLLLTKSDLANPQATTAWLAFYQKQQQPALAITSTDFKASLIEKKIVQILQGKIKTDRAKGLRKKRIRVLCIGIPNVGKSTLLNRLAGRKAAQIGNRPGVTKAQQWIKVGQNLDLLDTPGILWPKFENQQIAKKLALTGAIKDTLYAIDDVALYALEFFKNDCPQNLLKRYRLQSDDLQLALPDLLLKITKLLGMKDDYERASQRIIWDCRHGKLGKFTLDEVPFKNGSAIEKNNE